MAFSRVARIRLCQRNTAQQPRAFSIYRRRESLSHSLEYTLSLHSVQSKSLNLLDSYETSIKRTSCNNRRDHQLNIDGYFFSFASGIEIPRYFSLHMREKTGEDLLKISITKLERIQLSNCLPVRGRIPRFLHVVTIRRIIRGSTHETRRAPSHIFLCETHKRSAHICLE